MAKTIRLNDYHNSEQVSKVLGVSIARVSQLLIEKKIAGIKAGGKFWLIEKKSLAEYVAALKRIKGDKGVK
jgi:excisionase family DNA binding protein